MYTVFTKPDEVRIDWYIVDAAGKTLGRLASQIAHRLKGKHKPNYAPHQDLGDHIVVINAGTVKVTGAKLTDKFYHQHTGYVGNLKSIALGKLLQEHPERAIEFAIKGMLPKGPLAAACTRSCMCSAAANIPIKHNSPKRWKSRKSSAGNSSWQIQPPILFMAPDVERPPAHVFT
jgi:large subunit ribosomal protein L13